MGVHDLIKIGKLSNAGNVDATGKQTEIKSMKNLKGGAAKIHLIDLANFENVQNHGSADVSGKNNFKNFPNHKGAALKAHILANFENVQNHGSADVSGKNNFKNFT